MPMVTAASELSISYLTLFHFLKSNDEPPSKKLGIEAPYTPGNVADWINRLRAEPDFLLQDLDHVDEKDVVLTLKGLTLSGLWKRKQIPIPQSI